MNPPSPSTKVCALLGAGAGLAGAAVFWLLVYGVLAPPKWLLPFVLPSIVVAVPYGACVGAVVRSAVGGWRMAALGIALAVVASALVASAVLVAMTGGEFAASLGWFYTLLLVDGFLFVWPAVLGGLAAAAAYRGAVLAYMRRGIN
jgi:hypothetical protein